MCLRRPLSWSERGRTPELGLTEREGRGRYGRPRTERGEHPLLRGCCALQGNAVGHRLASVILPNRFGMAPLVSPLFRPTHHPPGGTSGSALSFGLAWVILSLGGRG